MSPSLLAQSVWIRSRAAGHMMAAAFPSSSRHQLMPKASQRNPSYACRGQSSYGISYLDTWMGNQKRRPLAPANAVKSEVQPHQTNILNCVGSSDTKSDTAAQHNPSSFYQLYTLRPNGNTDPQSLIEAFDKNVFAGSITVPVVLDMAAYHPDGSPHYSPPAPGTLAKLVNTIRNERISNTKICIVGVSNLPPPERNGQMSKMTIEAQTLNLPILQNSTNTQQMHNYLSRESLSTSSVQTQSPPRKKRGGVAPLLKPRRPGVSGTAGSIATDRKITASCNEKDSVLGGLNVSATTSQREETFPTTKVHKGSIRSGQLVTSDYPNQSLVILGSINPGGEVWSEGDVFVFGKLRGRVLAGLRNVGEIDAVSSEREVAERPLSLSNDRAEIAQECTQVSSSQNNKPKQSSRIFATFFDPELICIGDVFTTVDNVSKLGLDSVGPAMVTLDIQSGQLVVEKLDL